VLRRRLGGQDPAAGSRGLRCQGRRSAELRQLIDGDQGCPTTAAPLSGVGTRRKPRRSLAPWLLLSPAGVAVVLVTVIPIGFLVFASFTDYDQRSLFTGEFSMVGLAQYVEIFTSAEFWKSVLRTVWFTAAMVLGTIVIGTGVAQLMTRIS